MSFLLCSWGVPIPKRGAIAVPLGRPRKAGRNDAERWVEMTRRWGLNASGQAPLRPSATFSPLRRGEGSRDSLDRRLIVGTEALAIHLIAGAIHLIAELREQRPGRSGRKPRVVRRARLRRPESRSFAESTAGRQQER